MVFVSCLISWRASARMPACGVANSAICEKDFARIPSPRVCPASLLHYLIP